MMTSTQFCPVCGAATEPGYTYCIACGQLLATSGDGQEAQDEPLLHDRYQLGRLLGSGGFSAVYRAHDLLAGRDVAIKQLSLHGLSTEEIIEFTDTFNREVDLLSGLHHPQVPRIHNHFSDREHWYLVMDYLEGTTLETYLHTRAARGQPLQVEEVLAMGVQLCTVLEYLHTRQPPVIFRDLKPGNILRSPGGTLHLIDFGIARHFRPGQAHDTQALGSPGYAAPEQYGHAQTTPQSDIYSLGVLLCTLLSGQDPSEQPLGLSPLRPKVCGPEFSALVQSMLSPDPADRPATVREVATLPAPSPQMAVQQAMQMQPPAQPGNIASPTPSRRISRRRVLIGLSALSAAAVAGGGIWWLYTNTSPSPYLYSYSGHTQAVSGVAWSHDGRRIASASWDHTVQVWDATTGGHVLTYRGHADVVNAVAWSHDGSQLASGSSDHTVQVWDATIGRHVLTFQGHTASVNAVAWSPNGRQLASASDDSTIQVWDATTGGHVLTYRGHTVSVNAVAWSPNGKRIASASGSNEYTVQVWDATIGRHVLTYQGHKVSVNAVAWSPDGKRIASASSDDTVQVWDATTGGIVFTYAGHAAPVLAVAWSSDGKHIASGSSDDTVQVWVAP